VLPRRWGVEGGEKREDQRLSDARAILVVDDESRLRRVLGRALGTEGFSILEASTTEEALKTFGETQVDLVTLDLNLGHSDGLQLAREMRAIRNVPLVMITGRDSQIDRIVGLESGADDYIVKPFNLRETVLRIKCVLRRYGAPLTPSESDAPSSGSRVRAFDHCVLDGTFYLSKTYHVDCARADGYYWVRLSALADGAGMGMPSRSNALAWIDVGRVVTVIS